MPTNPSAPANATAASRNTPDLELAHEVAEIFTHLFGDRRSIIDPQVEIWTADAAEELRSRIEDDPLEGSEMGQWEKLDIQLTDAPPAVILLAAELVFLREHPLRSSLPTTRRKHVAGVLANLDTPVALPPRLESCLSRPSGVAGLTAGMRYNGVMWQHITWAATFVRYCAELSEDQRAAAMSNPWELQRMMLASGTDQSDIRNVFQFLARPDTFEPISLASMKTRIRDGLADRIGGGGGQDPATVDRDLLAIRGVLAREISDPFQFWSSGVRELWEPPTISVQDDEPRPRHTWLYSPGDSARDWDAQRGEEIMAIGWDPMGDLDAYASREAVREALEQHYPGASGKISSLALWQFQHEIEIGDIVYAKHGRRRIVGRGEVVSDARHAPERAEYQHVRSVKWTQVGVWEHPGHAVTKTLTDITPYRDYLAALEALVVENEDEIQTETPTVSTALQEYGAEQFLAEVFFSEEHYDRLRSLVLRKKNIILAGPPGVGKTYAARRLAYAITGAKDPDRIETVQFHQSYAYEDFMMGYRPTEGGGFTLRDGPFYRFCERAREDDSDRPYFFIIDEINRGNISKIFGELLMLIEADKRGQEILLLYRNETFSVPTNVHIIGMMNTADRSLAVLDYALRRRFGFFQMSPGFHTDGFRHWRASVDDPRLDKLTTTIVDLNRSISDDPALGEGFRIGHSFLMASPSHSTDEDWLFSVIEDELVPLLDEYWFDDPAQAQEWAQRLRAALG